MLRRKFYAQRNNGSTSNPGASTSGSRLRMNTLKRQRSANFNFLRVPDVTQQQYIEEKRVKEIVCTGATDVTPQTTCANYNGKTIGNKKVCSITKDLTTKTQGDYTASYIPEKCVLTQEKKPMGNNVC